METFKNLSLKLHRESWLRFGWTSADKAVFLTNGLAFTSCVLTVARDILQALTRCITVCLQQFLLCPRRAWHLQCPRANYLQLSEIKISDFSIRLQNSDPRPLFLSAIDPTVFMRMPGEQIGYALKYCTWTWWKYSPWSAWHSIQPLVLYKPQEVYKCCYTTNCNSWA